MEEATKAAKYAAAIRAACRRGGYIGDPITNLFQALAAAFAADPEETARIIAAASRFT